MTDTYLFLKLNSLVGRNYWLDLAGILFSWYAGYVLIGVALIFLTMKYGQRNLVMIWWALIATAVARFGIVELIRFFYNRPRPFEVLDIIQLVRYDPGHSFPSGHAAFFFAFSTTIFQYNRRLGAVFWVISGLISLARVFAGVHWPADVLAGAAIGVLVGWITTILSRGKNKTLITRAVD